VTSLLAGLKDAPALPGLVHEAEPRHATTKNIADAQPDKVAPLTVEKLSDIEKGALTSLLAARKAGDGAAFDANAVTTSYLSTLADIKKGA